MSNCHNLLDDKFTLHDLVHMNKDVQGPDAHTSKLYSCEIVNIFTGPQYFTIKNCMKITYDPKPVVFCTSYSSKV